MLIPVRGIRSQNVSRRFFFYFRPPGARPGCCHTGPSLRKELKKQSSSFSLIPRLGSTWAVSSNPAPPPPTFSLALARPTRHLNPAKAREANTSTLLPQPSLSLCHPPLLPLPLPPQQQLRRRCQPYPRECFFFSHPVRPNRVGASTTVPSARRLTCSVLSS